MEDTQHSNPAVSVIMSVYNGERYLRNAVESILGQTFTDFEFIIVNDGSTDRSGGILADYADDRIRLINNSPNVGLTPSLNRALALARGRYIARMDADDISLPNRLEEQVKFLESHKEYVLVGTSPIIIDPEGHPIRKPRYPLSDRSIRAQLAVKSQIVHGSVLIRRTSELLYNESCVAAQDYDLWVRLIRKGKVANLSQRLYKWRSHKDNVSSSREELQKAVALNVATKYQSALLEEGKIGLLLQGCMHEAGLEEARLSAKSLLHQSGREEDVGWCEAWTIAHSRLLSAKQILLSTDLLLRYLPLMIVAYILLVSFPLRLVRRLILFR